MNCTTNEVGAELYILIIHFDCTDVHVHPTCIHSTRTAPLPYLLAWSSSTNLTAGQKHLPVARGKGPRTINLMMMLTMMLAMLLPTTTVAVPEPDVSGLTSTSSQSEPGGGPALMKLSIPSANTTANNSAHQHKVLPPLPPPLSLPVNRNAIKHRTPIDRRPLSKTPPSRPPPSPPPAEPKVQSANKVAAANQLLPPKRFFQVDSNLGEIAIEAGTEREGAAVSGAASSIQLESQYRMSTKQAEEAAADVAKAAQEGKSTIGKSIGYCTVGNSRSGTPVLMWQSSLSRSVGGLLASGCNTVGGIAITETTANSGRNGVGGRVTKHVMAVQAMTCGKELINQDGTCAFLPSGN